MKKLFFEEVTAMQDLRMSQMRDWKIGDLSLVENQLSRIPPFEWYLLTVLSLTSVYKG